MARWSRDFTVFCIGRLFQAVLGTAARVAVLSAPNGMPSDEDTAGSVDPVFAISFKHLSDVKKHGVHLQGYVDGQDKFQKFIIEYQMASGVSFVTRTSKCRRSIGTGVANAFGSVIHADKSIDSENEHEKTLAADEKSHSPLSRKFFWKSGNGFLRVPFLGVPFEIGNYYIKQCAHGKEYQHARLQKKRNETSAKKSRKSSTKKLGCNATLYIKEIIMYPEYELDTTEKIPAKRLAQQKMELSNLLKENLSSDVVVSTITRCYIAVPLISTHNHTTGDICESVQPVHPVIGDKIYELVGKGVTNTRLVTHELRQFVKHNLLPNTPVKPLRSDRQFYPTRLDVKNHVLLASLNQKYSEIEKSELEKENNGYVILQQILEDGNFGTDAPGNDQRVAVKTSPSLEVELGKLGLAMQEVMDMCHSATDPRAVERVRIIVETGKQELQGLGNSGVDSRKRKAPYLQNYAKSRRVKQSRTCKKITLSSEESMGNLEVEIRLDKL